MSKGAIAVGTVFAKNYLSFARVLAASFRRHHPEVPFVGVLADQPQGRFDPEAEPFRIIELTDVRIPALDSLTFRYDRFAVSVAAKAYLLEHLLDEYESALFLDVDTLVLGDLGELLEETHESAITLVPHLLEPLDGPDRAARELNILQSGVLNAGVVGVSDCDAARRFLAWWRERVHRNCRHSLAEGLHHDQRWLDFATVFFPEAQLYRDPRVNVAHWNLPERFSVRNGWRLFHFSGYEPDRPERVTQYANRVAMSSELRQLFSEYQHALEEAGWYETRAWPYAYDHWDNGIRIPDVVRELYRDMGEEVVAFGNPFRTASRTSLFHWLRQPLDGDRRVTRLWAQILYRRPDVQHAFPDPFGADRERFVAWALLSGTVEHDIPDALLRR